jgi:hypothetical protein
MLRTRRWSCLAEIETFDDFLEDDGRSGSRCSFHQGVRAPRTQHQEPGHYEPRESTAETVGFIAYCA